MLKRQIVSHRQTAWLTGSLLTSGTMITFSQSLVQVAKMDAWFSQVIPVCYAILVAFVLMELARTFPGKTLFEIVFAIFGRWIGGMINLLLLFYIWVIVTVDIKEISQFLKESLLPRTPLGVILLVFVLLVMSYRKLDVVSRVSEIYFPINIVVILLLTLMLTNEFSMDRFEPIFSTDLFAIFGSNYMTVGLYGEVLLMGAFLPAFSQSRLFFVSMKHGIVLAGFLISIIILVFLGVMGYNVGGSLNYPIWSLVQQIHVTDFLDRVELLLLSLWFPALTIKVILAYLALSIGIGSFSGMKQYGVYSPALGTFLVSTSLLSFREAEELPGFVGYSLTAIVLAIQIPLLLVLFLFAKMRKAQTDDDGSRIPKRRVMAWICNLSILGCAATVVVGKLMFEAYLSVGLIISIVYFAFLVVGVIASYAEMQIVNNYLYKKQQDMQNADS